MLFKLVLLVGAFCVSACGDRASKEVLVKRYNSYCASSIEVKPTFFHSDALRYNLGHIVETQDDDLQRVVKIVRNNLDMCDRFGTVSKFEFRSEKFEYLTVYYRVGRENLENKVEFAFARENGELVIAQTKLFGPPNYP